MSDLITLAKFSIFFIGYYFLEILDGIKEKAPKHQTR